MKRNVIHIIAQVRKIDKSAANWLKVHVERCKGYFPEATTLSQLFIFNKTPQGHAYWWRIHEKMEE